MSSLRSLANRFAKIKQFFCFHKYEKIEWETITKYIGYFPQHVFWIKHKCKKCWKVKEFIEVS